MQGTDYNVALSLYFVSYCLFEVPANLMLKKLRPSMWLSSITVLWGLVMVSMGFVQNYAGLVAVRDSQGWAVSKVVLYLTLWYPRHLVQYRIATIDEK